MMLEHPIIFQRELIPSIDDGSKTQTRRTWGLEKINKEADRWLSAKPIPRDMLLHEAYKAIWQFTDKDGCFRIVRCPYGGIGSLLWRKETWFAESQYDNLKPSEIPISSLIGYPARDYMPDWAGKLRSPLFMPRWVSRETLEIIDVRGERVQEITEEDAIAEGMGVINYHESIDEVEKNEAKKQIISPKLLQNARNEAFINMSPQAKFCVYWNFLNAKRSYGWDKNPWEFTISFKEVG